MTTKDWIYLCLIGLAALVFYYYGFFLGVNRSRIIYEVLLREGVDDLRKPKTPAPEATFPRKRGNITNYKSPYDNN